MNKLNTDDKLKLLYFQFNVVSTNKLMESMLFLVSTSINIRSILLLSPRLRLDLPRGLFSVDLVTKIF